MLWAEGPTLYCTTLTSPIIESHKTYSNIFSMIVSIVALFINPVTCMLFSNFINLSCQICLKWIIYLFIHSSQNCIIYEWVILPISTSYFTLNPTTVHILSTTFLMFHIICKFYNHASHLDLSCFYPLKHKFGNVGLESMNITFKWIGYQWYEKTQELFKDSRHGIVWEYSCRTNLYFTK